MIWPLKAQFTLPCTWRVRRPPGLCRAGTFPGARAAHRVAGTETWELPCAFGVAGANHQRSRESVCVPKGCGGAPRTLAGVLPRGSCSGSSCWERWGLPGAVLGALKGLGHLRFRLPSRQAFFSFCVGPSLLLLSHSPSQISGLVTAGDVRPRRRAQTFHFRGVFPHFSVELLQTYFSLPFALILICFKHQRVFCQRSRLDSLWQSWSLAKRRGEAV